MTDLLIREAVRADLPAVLALLADDAFGKTREAPVIDNAYERAFAAITADPRNQLIVGEQDGTVVACLQVTYIPGLGRHGTERAQIEAVRVASQWRGRQIGRQMMNWVIETADRRGCGLIQLTSDKRREDAHRFYRRLGFVDSHEGMKLAL